jgi:hypothetical protein
MLKMKTPIIKYSDKLLDKISWTMKVGGITIYPFIILRKKCRKAGIIIKNHESIHIKQQQELLVLPFYVLYLLEWLLKLPKYGKQAYYNISFEREAYANESKRNYLQTRKNYSWINRIFK